MLVRRTAGIKGDTLSEIAQQFHGNALPPMQPHKPCRQSLRSLLRSQARPSGLVAVDFFLPL
jgi:hypothetical protein